MPKPLADVRAHVSVTLNDGIDSSAPFIAKLKRLGARASARFRDDGCTHLVWRGDASTLARTVARYRDAKAKDVAVVSPLWITACERAGTKVDIASYVVRVASATPSAASKFSRVATPPTATTTAVAVKLGKRPREVEVVDIERYSSASRLELEAMAAIAATVSTTTQQRQTWADVAGRQPKRQKPAGDSATADDDAKHDAKNDSTKENAAPEARAQTTKTWAAVVAAKADAA